MLKHRFITMRRYIYILHRSEGGRKKTTTENQRFSVVFYGLIDPLVIRLEPLNSDAVW